MQKEGLGLIPPDKDLRGEHGWCLGHCNSVFHLLQVNQKLIKYLLFRVWGPCRSHLTQDCSGLEGSAHVADSVPLQADPLNTDTSQTSHTGKIFKKAIGRLLQQAISKKYSFLVKLLGWAYILFPMPFTLTQKAESKSFFSRWQCHFRVNYQKISISHDSPELLLRPRVLITRPLS